MSRRQRGGGGSSWPAKGGRKRRRPRTRPRPRPRPRRGGPRRRRKPRPPVGVRRQRSLPRVEHVPELRRRVAQPEPEAVDDCRRVLLLLLLLLLSRCCCCCPAPRPYGGQLAQGAVQTRDIPLDPRRQVRDLRGRVVEGAGPPRERCQGAEPLGSRVDPGADGGGATREVGLGRGRGGGCREGGC